MGMTLKAARVNKGLTQEQAAKALNISTESLRNYERGKSFPRVSLIKRIEDVYELSYNDIIFIRENDG